MSGYLYLRPAADARVGQLTPGQGALVGAVALVGTALAFAYLASSYRPEYPQLRSRRRGG